MCIKGTSNNNSAHLKYPRLLLFGQAKQKQPSLLQDETEHTSHSDYVLWEHCRRKWLSIPLLDKRRSDDEKNQQE